MMSKYLMNTIDGTFPDIIHVLWHCGRVWWPDKRRDIHNKRLDGVEKVLADVDDALDGGS